MSTKDELYKGFDNIPTRKGRGGEYAYVRWQDVADRMNQVFGIGWSSEVLFQDIVGPNVIVRVRVMVFDSATNTVQYQEGFGGAPNDERTEAGNSFKAAYSKALKDACKKWGVGLYLDEEGEGPSYGTEPSHTQTKAPLTPPPGYAGKETATPPTPSTPSGPTSGGMPLPPGVAMGGGSAPSNMPPSTPPPETKPALPQDLPMSSNKAAPIATPGSGAGTGEDLISDVQKAALQSILNMQGVKYQDLAREAFEVNGLDGKSIPEINDLTYTQAVYVVKYGNDKFRNR